MPRWTDEARRKQAAIQKTRQSWKHSTGPRTAAGKARARMNAYRHGLYSAPAVALNRVLKDHRAFLRALRRKKPCAFRVLNPRDCAAVRKVLLSVDRIHDFYTFPGIPSPCSNSNHPPNGIPP